MKKLSSRIILPCDFFHSYHVFHPLLITQTKLFIQLMFLIFRQETQQYLNQRSPLCPHANDEVNLISSPTRAKYRYCCLHKLLQEIKLNKLERSQLI